jgi:hypothetical protein
VLDRHCAPAREARLVRHSAARIRLLSSLRVALHFLCVAVFSARLGARLQGDLPFQQEDMAKTNTTKKKAPSANGEGEIAAGTVMERVAEAAATIAGPIAAKAKKLKRVIKKAVAPTRNRAPEPATPQASGDGASAMAGMSPAAASTGADLPAKPAKATRLIKPIEVETRATQPVVETASVPPPPIQGVTKPAAAPKRAAKPRAGARPPRSPASADKRGFTQDDVALRAYFIAQRRHAEGRHGNPESDWLEAERELRAELGMQVSQ